MARRCRSPCGTKLGQYEIGSPLGAGGMGEVYCAYDTKLGRQVALKVLPDTLARDAERMGRFEREAKVLASLNHPNIAAIYGFEDSGMQALVMELVEGPTLAERIAPAPISQIEALPIAKQICEALEYAHERGIVHRDLKPANVKITSDGAVKLLDFGLAKALEGDRASADIANSPTMTGMATQAGIVLGTAAYMSPEQARGRTVDRRADIWSFGVVLFEILAGRRVFVGETATDIMAEVVRAEPDWALLPKDVPPRIRELLRRCLVKDEKRRLRDIGDARLAIEDALVEAPEELPVTARAPARKQLWHWMPWAIAAAAMVIAAWGLLRRTDFDTVSGAVMHLDVTYPPNVEPVSGLPGGFAVSPDGRSVAMVGVRDGCDRRWAVHYAEQRHTGESQFTRCHQLDGGDDTDPRRRQRPLTHVLLQLAVPNHWDQSPWEAPWVWLTLADDFRELMQSSGWPTFTWSSLFQNQAILEAANLATPALTNQSVGRLLRAGFLEKVRRCPS